MIARTHVALLGVLVIGMWFHAGCKSGPDTRPADDGRTAGGEAEGGSERGRLAGVSGAQPGEKVQAFDLNDDKKPDVWAYYGPLEDPANPGKLREGLVRKEWDFNFDGKVDIRRYYNYKEEVVKDEMDLDFDGKFDVATYWQGGTRVRQEYDFNFDGKTDSWKYYEKGQVVRIERDRDYNGRVDRWEYFVEGKLDRTGLDEDGDGQIDKWIQQTEEK